MVETFWQDIRGFALQAARPARPRLPQLLPPRDGQLAALPGVMGFSYSAYSTALLITRTDLFKAAISKLPSYAGLRRLGKKVVYARYEGEGHTPTTWRRPNQMDYLNRLLAWFDEHLKTSP